MPSGKDSQYPEFNLKKLHGVFGFSVFTGILVAIQIQTGLDISETGIMLMIMNAFASSLGTPSPYLIPVITIIITIADILVTLFYIRLIAEHKKTGAFVSGCGFFGSLSVILGSMSGSSLPVMYFGIILWVAGVLVAAIKDER